MAESNPYLKPEILARITKLGLRAQRVVEGTISGLHRSPLHGLSVEMAEAMAEYVHKRIRAELGFAAEDDRDMEKMLSQGYRGSRYSFGYPACPKLEDQAPILSLLGAERIGLSLSEEFQLHPEQSTSAIVVLNPHAKYFSV